MELYNFLFTFNFINKMKIIKKKYHFDDYKR